MGQVVDINLQTVNLVCDLLGVHNKKEVIFRVQKLFLNILHEHQQNAYPLKRGKK